jgi:hypothetical protein
MGVRARRTEVEETTWLCRQLGRALSAEALSLALEKLHRASRPIGCFFGAHPHSRCSLMRRGDWMLI